jgi:MoxR-like ATPase
MLQFQGHQSYVADQALIDDVNAALLLGRPLLLKGEPGTGKSVLAKHIAEALGLRCLFWNVKSSSKAQEGLYTYDTVQRLNDARFGDGDVRDIRRYIKLGPLGEALRAEERVVLLIDEIDKADLEFPNDLLFELDLMQFQVFETGETVTAKHRPFIIVTSNAEKELPDAFLRRCVFHYIAFPERDRMQQIVKVHFPEIEESLIHAALERFYQIREIGLLRKKPATSELLDWLHILIQKGVENEALKQSTPALGVLLKTAPDLEAAAKVLAKQTA